MKEIMQGNAAIARGAWEAGVKVAAAYPGTPSSEILKDVADNYPEIYAEWSPNEMVAVQVASGAAIAGARAMASMKHVGMNVASDALMTLAYTGIKGGLMIVVADDPNVHSSQNEQDSRNWARFGKVPMLEPGDAQECYEFAKASFDISEKFDTPVLLRTVTRIAHADSLVQTGKRVESKMPMGLDPKEATKYVMVPANVRPRRKIIEERMRKLEAFADKTKLNKMEINSKSVGIIASGAAYMYAKEVFPEYSFLKLGMVWPLPKKMIADFFKQVKKVMIIEELDPFFETEIRAMGYKVFHGKDIIPNMYELSPEIVEQAIKGKAYKAPKIKVKPEDLPRRPPNLCAGCSHRPLFYALKKLGAFVFGDIGCYTLAVAPPISALHTTICMGA
ncbi:MAG TPA: indolepyruvate ferredoxin oxidoreductase subunit alpha, partial [Deltaproteobacteria bacterium]|nr:indolepyruvate ferredoxin oxidoreductase subunit alpha [Deltaproteobacteria bacterium]